MLLVFVRFLCVCFRVSTQFGKNSRSHFRDSARNDKSKITRATRKAAAAAVQLGVRVKWRLFTLFTGDLYITKHKK